jgi:uncharacterized protein (TIGR03437 family)
MGAPQGFVKRLIAVGILLCAKAHSQFGVTTYRNNLARSGENLEETILTPKNVAPVQFGKLFSHPVDGQVYAQPLYLSSVPIPDRGIHNVVFIATAHDSVYAFDADSTAGPDASPLWQVSLASAVEGERPASAADVLGCNSITPEIGIIGTPVIDTGTGTLYVVALSIRSGSFVHRLHALDIATGSERAGSPVVIDASVPGTGDGLSTATTSVPFHPYLYKNRAGLLLLNGVVYTAWGSHCDTGPYHGWIIGYDAKDLRQVSVFNSSPNAWQASFWMGGAAPAADSDGNIYVVSGNGLFDAQTSFGDSFLKLASTGSLAVADYFTPFNQAYLDRSDLDLGSSGAVLLPDSAGSSAHPHLLVSAGKEGRIYLLDRDGMGQFNAGGDSQVVQSLAGAIGPLYGGPAYFQNTVYFSASNDALKAFSVSEGRLGASPVSRSSQVFGYPGAVPTISASGSSNGILWLLEGGSGGTLHAYDASNVANELYNSQMKGSRDSLGSFVRFSVPTVANGKVYVGTGNSLVAFGLIDQLPQPLLSAVVNAASFQPGPVAPGSLISIFGLNLAQTTASSLSAQLSSTLGGVTLFVNGVPAPLQFVSPGQINAQVPFEVTGGLATAELRLPAMPPAAIQFQIAPVAPGIFANGANQAAARNADGTLNTQDNPAAAGSLITVYLTGQGAVQPPAAGGAPSPIDSAAQAAYNVTVTVGGQPATVMFSGLSPGSAGLFQVSLRLPLIGSGSYPVEVSVNGVKSNTRLIAVLGS